MSTSTIQERAELVIAGKFKYTDLNMNPSDIFELDDATLNALDLIYFTTIAPNASAVIVITETKPIRACEHCGRKLVVIGSNRKNGDKKYTDWETRKYHKKCMKYVR